VPWLKIAKPDYIIEETTVSHPIAIDYYFTPSSPWTYLGHARFDAIAKSHGAAVRVRPVDFGAIFPLSGGLPLGKRAPQRQAYRLIELARFSRHLGVPLNLQPKFFPVSGDDASRLIIAVDLDDGADAAMKLCGAIFAAVWTQERNIADPQVLEELAVECGLPAGRVEQSRGPVVQARYEDDTRQAIAANVFGAPSYVIDGEIFWGQDRLEFVERALEQQLQQSRRPS
jgi:2-hydroxychromene-2-carboxylate isomerase